jgi:lipoprotein signal peptidase
MFGAHTRALNLAATGLVVGLLVMLVPALARVDRRSTVALALVAGGGAGNLVSLAASARGVEDFLAWRHAHGAVVVNVADVAMAAGLLLLGRTLWQLARAVRTHGPRARLGALSAR